MKKTLYLHVGMGKTGTTALQEFFWHNRNELAKHNICYPEIGATCCAHHLISPHIPVFLNGSGWVFLNTHDWVEPLDKATECQSILMSSELIAWSTHEKIQEFCAELSRVFNLKICFYLRRQDNILMAGYNQQVKAGTQLKPLEEVLDLQLEKFDYLSKIWPWESAVGAENIIIRPYEKSQFYGRSLLSDFLHYVLNINTLDGFLLNEDGKNANPRFSYEALEFKRLINNVFPNIAESTKFNEPLIAYSSQLSNDEQMPFKEQEILDHSQRLAVLKHCNATNSYIARKFLNRKDGILFNDALTQKPNERKEIGNESLLLIVKYIKFNHRDLFDLLLNKTSDFQAIEAYQAKICVKKLHSLLSS